MHIVTKPARLPQPHRPWWRRVTDRLVGLWCDSEWFQPLCCGALIWLVLVGTIAVVLVEVW